MNSVQQFTWCMAGTGEIPDSRTCLVATTDAKIQNNTIFAFYNSNNFGKTVSVPSNMVHLTAKTIYIQQNFIFVSTLEPNANTSYLYVSNNSGKTFNKALIPDGNKIPFNQQSRIIKNSESYVFIGIETKTEGLKRGSVFISDNDGLKYSIAISGVPIFSGRFDFGIIQSVESTLIANKVLSDELDLTEKLQTWISFDNSNTWNRLIVVSDVDCKSKCHLNLIGTKYQNSEDRREFFWSVPEALGLIIGTGSIGESIKSDDYSISTFISTNGGLLWKRIVNGSTVFEYGNRGGLLVFVNNEVITDTLYYSLDSGLTVNSFVFSNVAIFVNSIFSVDHTSTKFVIEGKTGLNTNVYIGVDFAGL